MNFSIEIKDLLSNKSKFYSSNSNIIEFGRKSSNEFCIDNGYISENHATFSVREEKLYIKDNNSSNGSEFYCNHKWVKLENKKRLVKLPIQIRLAKAIVISINSGESQLISLSQVENEEAIMVLDICNSTSQSLNNEQIAFHLKQRLYSISKPIIFSQSVIFLKNTGDGFLATFPKTTNAVNAAIKILKTLELRNNKSNNPPINIRIGLHTGKTYVIDPATEDIHGIDINITFRIEGLKKSALKSSKIHFDDTNRILSSESFYTDYKKRTRRKKEIFEYCGLVKLKGIKEKKKIYKINWK